MLHALAGSPYATAQALQQLAGEDERRELRLDELRYALGTLKPDQLFLDLPPTVGRIVHTLLTAESRLSQREFATRANVLARAIQMYQERLEALDLVRVDERGYRLALSFQTAVERRDPVIPLFLKGEQLLLDAADAFLEATLSRSTTVNRRIQSGVRCFGHQILTDCSSTP